jgi:DNA-binding PadR family transcriptional regulator
MSYEHDTSKESEHLSLSTQNLLEANRARKSIIYELFVLGELMDEPHHGYQLREILSNLLGPFRQISWGVLYPLIRQLEREKLLVSDTEVASEEGKRGTASSRQRKQYSITPTGQERFYTLMLARDDYAADYRELFTIKLNNFDHLSRKQQLILLQHYQGYLQIEDTYLQKGQQRVSTDPGIPDNQRAHILRTISFRRSSVESEIRWIASQIINVEKELDGTS